MQHAPRAIRYRFVFTVLVASGLTFAACDGSSDSREDAIDAIDASSPAVIDATATPLDSSTGTGDATEAGTLDMGDASGAADVDADADADADADTDAEDGDAGSGVGPDADADADAASVDDPIAESLVGADVPTHRIGMSYMVWHAAPVTALDNVVARGGARHNIEEVIRSNGALGFADIFEKHDAAYEAVLLHWNMQPQLGYYCIYRARTPGTGLVPDCKNITSTLTTHAAQLVAAGVDYVVVDATNLSTAPTGDLLTLRPTEVLFEEWAKLRAQGKKTPQIAIWSELHKPGTYDPTYDTSYWQSLLDLYSVPAYDGLVFRDRTTQKKVFFVVDSNELAPDPSKLQAVGAAGVTVQRVWTRNDSDPSLDRWAFMAACRTGGASPIPTTSIVGEGPCNQAYASASTLGKAVSVAASYQTGYASLPHGATGRLRGLTFQRQWATALAVMPDHVFLSSWNDFVSQPQVNNHVLADGGPDPYARSLGLERDPSGAKLFVDTYGGDLARDIEPTVEYGTGTYDLLRSCTRVFRKNVATNASGCGDSNELCCSSAIAGAYVNVFALRSDAAHDVVLTTSTVEKAVLVAGGWREVCARYGNPSVFCMKPEEPSTPLAPFMAFAAAASGRKPLQRCRAGAAHFYSLDAACEGQTGEGTVGYVADAPTGEMPRRLQRCFDAGTGEHTVSLGFPCPAGMTDEGTLGYVR